MVSSTKVASKIQAAASDSLRLLCWEAFKERKRSRRKFSSSRSSCFFIAVILHALHNFQEKQVFFSFLYDFGNDQAHRLHLVRKQRKTIISLVGVIWRPDSRCRRCESSCNVLLSIFRKYNYCISKDTNFIFIKKYRMRRWEQYALAYIGDHNCKIVFVKIINFRRKT